MSETKRKGENVKVQHTKQEKENLGKVVDPLPRAEAAKVRLKSEGIHRGQGDALNCLPNNGKHLEKPHDTENHECHCLVSLIKLDQEKDHPHHNWAENQAISQVSSHKIQNRSPGSYSRLKLTSKVKHALLRLS